jgi:hypothetical protein
MHPMLSLKTQRSRAQQRFQRPERQKGTSKKKKKDDFGPVHGGDAPPFMGGPMGGQYHLRMRL